MGQDGVRVSPNGERMSLRLLGRQESSESQKVVEYVKDWLAQIGIEVKVKIVSEDTLYETVGNGDYDMFEWGWVVEPDPDYQLSTFTCGQRSTEDGRDDLRRAVRLLLLRPGVRQAVQAAEAADGSRPSAPRPSGRCSRCCTTATPTS
ncbi:MAG: ABC transporter substrate-binding protein [Candidatus Nanopelagicales bacterium]